MRRIYSTLLLLLVLATGCNNESEPIINVTLPTTITDSLTAHLATHSGTNASAIAVVGAESMTWPDSSLGCPADGFSYMQVLTDGYKVTLDADGTNYTYHTSGDSFFVLCENGKPTADGQIGP